MASLCIGIFHSASKIWHSVGILWAIAAVAFLYRLYQTRSFMRRLQREGLPMPPHHPLFGHLLVAWKMVKRLPPDAHLLLMANQVRQAYPHLDTAFYFDTWPFSPPSLWVISPDMSAQFTQQKSFPKFKGLRQFLKPLTGKQDLVTMEGHDWKHWRAVSNPGFSTNYTTSMIPVMVKAIKIYRDIVHRHAIDDPMFFLEVPTLELSMDIIGRIVLDHEFECQTSYNRFTAALQNQLAWCNAGVHKSPFQYVNIVRPFVQQYNTWRMNSYLDPLLKSRYETLQRRPNNKNVTDLMMDAYAKEKSDANNTCPTKMDPDFSEFVRSQVKLFLQAGHDTTAASIVYTFYLLSKNPGSMCRLREELDSIFGPDATATCDLLKENAHLLGQCKYLLAVTKEALRLYPPSSTVRFGPPGSYLVDPNGKRLPTENCLIVGCHQGLHRNPRFWPRADEFVPERWLVDEKDLLYPVKNGWRPFERGPRNCLGQELAMTEIRLVVAVLVREFEFRDAYSEYDLKRGQALDNMRVSGDRAYQVEGGGCHPSERFPCVVSFAHRTSTYLGQNLSNL
ncbi:hypothetical protein AJ79_03333 [Helicocarpus griseus UAMH5409]|uniref:Uncharacterized protein n=1 Tax=Helicocarpus griseus UAMH5409 TaxID=1447875 RepID=A0A2B7XZC1_9EURO|nr:hypothetical protein AJ79_03333 [Helicocarpus griseus UAMH5409]